MKRIQYTIRAVPTKLDSTLRQRSKNSGKSLNEVVLITLAKGAGLAADQTFNDLDWFIGQKELDETSFDEAIAWLDTLPKDL